MRLDDYLARIDYRGPVAPDLACLRAIHRRHLIAIPYEDLDVQLGRLVDLDPERIFDKLVAQRRGGWCYEMNGLLCWALREIGFEVTRMVGGVMRAVRGDEAMGNHLVLRVDLDVPFLADVGIGNGMLEPTRLEAGPFAEGTRKFRLEVLDDGLWRFHNHAGDIPPSFDFSPQPDEELLRQTCSTLQQEASSLFRQNLLCMQPDGIRGSKILIGRVLSLPGREKTILQDAEAFRLTLEQEFGLRDPEFSSLWPRVVARHHEIFGDDSTGPSPA